MGAISQNRLARLLQVALFFLLAKLFVAGIALYAGADPLQPDDFARWDSGHYLAIAARGYEFAACPAGSAVQWCGNTAWMPGYSFLIRGLGAAGLGGPLAGVLIAWLALAATLFISEHILRPTPARIRFLLMGIAVFFPGMIYYHAIFPVALFVCCAFLFLIALEAGHAWRAAFWGGLAAFTYSPGILLAMVAGLRFLLFETVRAGQGDGSTNTARSFFERLSSGTIAAAGPTAGFLLSLLIQYLDTGEPAAFFLIQRQYGRDFAPIGVIVWLAEEFLTSPFRPVRIAAFQSLAVAGGVVCLLWFARPWRSIAQSENAQRNVSAFLFLLVFWLFPLSIGQGLSLYRSEACLLPAVLLLLPRENRRSVRLFLILLNLFLLVLAFLMGDLFFRDMLV